LAAGTIERLVAQLERWLDSFGRGKGQFRALSLRSEFAKDELLASVVSSVGVTERDPSAPMSEWVARPGSTGFSGGAGGRPRPPTSEPSWPVGRSSGSGPGATSSRSGCCPTGPGWSSRPVRAPLQDMNRGDWEALARADPKAYDAPSDHCRHGRVLRPGVGSRPLAGHQGLERRGGPFHGRTGQRSVP
jgi:hypothetical protein